MGGCCGRRLIVGDGGSGVEHPGIARKLEGEAEEEGDDVQTGERHGRGDVPGGGVLLAEERGDDGGAHEGAQAGAEVEDRQRVAGLPVRVVGTCALRPMPTAEVPSAMRKKFGPAMRGMT